MAAGRKSANQKKRKLYTYCGAVYHYDRLLESQWKGSAMAVCARQAKANLAHQYREQAGMIQQFYVNLPDRVSSGV